MPPSSHLSPTPQQPGRLVVEVMFGLGNRLSALFSVWVAAQAENIPLTLIWKEDPGGFSHLFQPSDELTILTSAPVGSPPGEWPLLTDFSAELCAALAAGETRYFIARSLINYPKLPDWEFFARMRAAFARVQIHPDVARQIMPHAGPTIGVHARFNDNLPSMTSTPRWCYRWLFKSVVEQNPAQQIWCCGDAPRLIAELRNAYPQNVRVAASSASPTPPAGQTIADQQLAFAEILTLSRCILIIGSENSSFCKFASYVSGVRFSSLHSYRLTQKGGVIRILWQISHKALPEARGLAAVLAKVFKAIVHSRLFQDVPLHVSRKKFAAPYLQRLADAEKK